MNMDAKLNIDKKGMIGGWDISCENCPLLPHLKALKQKPRTCVTGVPITTCEFMEKDSLKNQEKKLTLECKYDEVGKK